MEPILTAKEMCDPEVDHIGIMAYAAYFSRFKPVRSSAEKVVMDVQPKNCYIGITVSTSRASCLLYWLNIVKYYCYFLFSLFWSILNNNFSLVHVLCILYYVSLMLSCCIVKHIHVSITIS